MPSAPGAPAARGGAALTATSLTSPLDFAGPTLTDAGAFPPDTQGTVGPSQFIVTINGRFRSYSKATGLADGALNADPDVFFSSVETPVGPGVGNFTSDPHIRYDRLSQRWIIVMIDVPFTNPPFATKKNRMMIARSDGSVITPATVWTFFQFQADPTDFADYPTPGIDANALYIGANMFSNTSGSFTGTKMFVVRKSSILGAGPVVVTPFTGVVGSSAGPFTPQGVDNFDPAATTGYFIGVDNAAFSRLDVRTVTNPGGAPVLSSDLAVTVPTTRFPINVDHLGNTGGSSGKLDALDDRLFAAQLRGGHIWTAHNIGVNASGVATSASRDGARWYEVDVSGAPSLVQSGTVFDSAASNPNSFWIPSVAVSGQNIMAIGGSIAGLAHHADTWFSGRLPSDPAGQVDAPTEYTATAAAYNPPADPGAPRRWGDYSFTSVDPEDDMTMWTIQEYASSTNTWGTRIARLRPPPPATPSSTTPAAVKPAQATIGVTVTGTSVAGSGFFDPGAGFAKRLQATVGCGATVNSATYVNPTTVQLSLNTTSATEGPCNVTVTNPDGQARTGTGLIRVDGTPPTCGVTAVRPGPPRQQDVTVQDTGSGLASITNIVITNGTVNVPAFAAGTTAPLVVTATTTDQSMPTTWSFDATDVAGNLNHCAFGSPPPPPDLTVSKSHTGNFVQGDTGRTYSLSVSNVGGSTTSGAVSVSDTLPAGLTATAISGTGWTCSLGTLSCTRSDTLAAGAAYPVITVTVNVASNAPASVTNSATVSGGGETNAGNDTDTDPTTITPSGPPPAPDLTVSKTHVGNFVQGDTGRTYSLTVSNVGSAATSGAVSATDTLPPAGLTATAISGTGWTCALATLTCTRSDALAAGASYPVITVTVNVASNAPASVVNSATVSGGGETNAGNDTATDPTTITSSGPPPPPPPPPSGGGGGVPPIVPIIPPAGSTPPPSSLFGPTPLGPPLPGKLALGSIDTSKTGVITIHVETPGAGGVTGVATMVTTSGRFRASAVGKRKAITYRRGVAHTRAAEKATLRLKPGRAARRLLRKGRTLRVALKVTTTADGTGAHQRKTAHTTVKIPRT